MLLFVTAPVVTANNYFYNNKGVFISNHNVDKLETVGYTYREIMVITQEQYDKVMSMNIISSISSDFILKSSDQVEEEPILSTMSYESSSGTYGDMKLIVNGTSYTDSNYDFKIFIKVSLEWLSPPSSRYMDLISINFSNNLQILDEYINGSQVPKFIGKMYYHEDYIIKYLDRYPVETTHTTKDHEIIYNGSNYDSYKYIIDEGLIVQMDLPIDYIVDTSSSQLRRYHKQVFSDFYVTLEADFIPKQSGLLACSFAGTYEHQTGTGIFKWENISLSITPPFFNYSSSIFVNDPNYDILGRNIFFNKL